MARKNPAKSAGEQMSALAKRFSFIKTAREVLTEVIAVPTCFVAVDFATRVWGWPIQRCCVVHGPSNEGKTSLVIGLCGSFVKAGGLAKYDDAERTTTASWASQLIGELAHSDRFHADRPDSYEKCVDLTREWHRAVAEAREAGEIPNHASGIQIVDSLRKLTPEDFMKKINKHGAGGEKGSIDGMGGRGAQIRAAMNAAWLDELVPLTDKCKTAWIAIARESEDPDADVWDKKFGNDYKVQGGKAIVYDAALRARVERDGWVTVEEDGKKIVVGEKHRVTILKTKVGQKKDRADVGFFHTSNGRLCPAGYDRARDVAVLAKDFGIVRTEGNMTVWKGEKWRSFERFVAAVRDAEGELETLESEVRADFENQAKKLDAVTEQEEAMEAASE